MTAAGLRAALISTDAGFRGQLRDILLDEGVGATLALEIHERFAAFGEKQVRELRHVNAELLILDLQDDPELGVQFAQFLSNTHPGHRILAVGPALSHEMLLSAMRAGVADYQIKPVNVDALRDSISRLSQSLGRGGAKAKRLGHIYTLFSPKGGSGVTSVATNLAVVLHRLTSKRTLLVDLDLELGEVALHLGVQPRFNFVDMVQNFHRMDADLLASYIEQHESGVHLLSAPFHPVRAEAPSGDEIRRILHFLRQHYDYVIVDTPKTFSPGTLAAFDQSELVLLVTNVDLPSLRNIQRGLPMLKRALPRGESQIRLIVNRYHSGGDITLADVERTLSLKASGTIRNDYDAVIGSINTGKPIVLNGKSKYTQDVRAIGAELAGLTTGPGSANGRGVVSRLLGRVRRKPQEKKP
ncbi:MAG: AAA family ATPase [Gemmatimonadales bacterium]|nr:AAA family ATPase [Gemmatimonadales bacterium]